MAAKKPKPLSLVGWIKHHRCLDLEVLRVQFESGDQAALVLAIQAWLQCSGAPDWVATAWERACYAIADRHVERWDELLANNHRKTVQQLIRERIEHQMVYLIRCRLNHYKQIPIRKNRVQLVKVGNRLVKAADRFETIAADLTADGKARRAFGAVSRSKARDLWYELEHAELSRRAKVARKLAGRLELEAARQRAGNDNAIASAHAAGYGAVFAATAALTQPSAHNKKNRK